MYIVIVIDCCDYTIWIDRNTFVRARGVTHRLFVYKFRWSETPPVGSSVTRGSLRFQCGTSREMAAEGGKSGGRD